MAAQERPHALELNVKNLTNALRAVSDWKMLGIQLGVKMQQISDIHYRNRDGGLNLCKADLLNHWLTNEPKPSWEKVAMALDEMDMTDVTREIRTAYCSSG